MVNILIEAVWSIDDKVAAIHLGGRKIERLNALKGEDNRRAMRPGASRLHLLRLMYNLLCHFYTLFPIYERFPTRKSHIVLAWIAAGLPFEHKNRLYRTMICSLSIFSMDYLPTWDSRIDLGR